MTPARLLLKVHKGLGDRGGCDLIRTLPNQWLWLFTVLSTRPGEVIRHESEGDITTMTVTAVGTQVIVLGVDTHQQTHHAAIVAVTGEPLADREFAATAAGYRQLIDWAGDHGRLATAGVESSASYGAGLTRALRAAQIEVVEVNAPDVAVRHRDGKTDRIDAYNAAMAVICGRAHAGAKDTTGIVESIRMLFIARASAVEARKQITGQLRDLATTAPAELADRLRGLSTTRRVAAIEKLNAPEEHELADPTAGFTYAAQSLVQRYRSLDREITTLTRRLDSLVATAIPTVISAPQIGTITGAQLLITAGQNIDRMGSEATFAKLTGVAPLPASSGKSQRHRINKGGDRQANSALHMIAVGRLKSHPPTHAYRDKRERDNLTRKDIIRCLKRFIAREVFHALQADLKRLDRL